MDLTTKARRDHNGMSGRSAAKNVLLVLLEIDRMVEDIG